MKRFIFLFLFLVSCTNNSLRNGIDNLFENQFDLIAGKNIGVICNHTAVTSAGEHLVDKLLKSENVNLAAIFSPEHGFTGNIEGGKIIESGLYRDKGIKLFSLYGKINKPTPEMLKDIDVMIYDIQDIGARFYTYISTLGLCMESAVENGKKIIILDRINPISGSIVEGPILKDGFKSFVGKYSISIRYGLTAGELANMINGEGWLESGLKADLKVIKVLNWKRDAFFSNYDTDWIKPSPNIPDFQSSLTYPGLCLLEGTNISEGRGTYKPFKLIGAPWIDADLLLKEMNSFNLPGVMFSTVEFIPNPIEGMALNPKYAGERCYGIEFIVTNPEVYQSIYTGTLLIYAIKKLFPDKFKWRKSLYIDKLWGDDSFRKMIDDNKKPFEIADYYENDLNEFMKKRQKYLIYK